MNSRSPLIRYVSLLSVLVAAPAFAEQSHIADTPAVPTRPTVQAGYGDGVGSPDVTVFRELALQSPEEPALLRSPAKATYRWYGWQTLATDVVAIASFVLVGTADEWNVLPAVGLGSNQRSASDASGPQ